MAPARIVSRPVDLTVLTEGDRVEGTFLVHEVQERVPETGNAYTVIVLGNQSGRLPTEPFWLERQPEIAGVRRGHVVQVIGEVARYRDRRQLKVRSIRVLPEGAAQLTQLLPAVDDVERYWDTLDGWRASVTKPRLRAVLDLFFEDGEFRDAFGACPASVDGHHAAVGGLLQHTTEVAAIARTIARTSGADLELVIAGAMLHDIGKLDAYDWTGPFAHTTAGRLMGHVVLGAIRFDRTVAAASPPPCTDEERDLLLHLILSHHGRREYGSPVPPLTLEAEVLHWADNASAKTASMAEILQDPGRFAPGSDFAEPHWSIDRRRVYRGVSGWGKTDTNS